MAKEVNQMYDLVDCQRRKAILAEIKTIIYLLVSDRIMEQFQSVCQDTVRLFNGAYPGYRLHFASSENII